MSAHDDGPTYYDPAFAAEVCDVELPTDATDPCVSACYQTGECHGSCGLSRSRP